MVVSETRSRQVPGLPDFVKVYPDAHADLLVAEATRLRWARRFVTVPRVVAKGPGWLHTAGLSGRSAVDPFWVARPAVAAAAIGAADRWTDLAIATLPLGWNYPVVEEDVLFDAYGVARDERRIAYYRARWAE